MTYNVFSGTLNLTQSINAGQRRCSVTVSNSILRDIRCRCFVKVKVTGTEFKVTA